MKQQTEGQSSVKSSYSLVCKLQWLACALVCIVYIGLSAIDVHFAITRFRGWALAIAVALGLLLLKYVVAGGIIVVRRLFVWSTYMLDDHFLTQTCFGKSVTINLNEPVTISYQFLFKETDRLTKPFYQCMVMRQGGNTIRVLPYHLDPPIEVDTMPDNVRTAWRLYDGQHPWFIMPKWAPRLKSLRQKT